MARGDGTHRGGSCGESRRITGAALPSVAADTIKAVVDDFYASAQELAEVAEAEYITDAGSDAALRVMQIAEGNVILALLASLVDSF